MILQRRMRTRRSFSRSARLYSVEPAPHSSSSCPSTTCCRLCEYQYLRARSRAISRSSSPANLSSNVGVVIVVGLVDLYCTRFFVAIGIGPAVAKIFATGIVLVLNFAGDGSWYFQRDPIRIGSRRFATNIKGQANATKSPNSQKLFSLKIAPPLGSNTWKAPSRRAFHILRRASARSLIYPRTRRPARRWLQLWVVAIRPRGGPAYTGQHSRINVGRARQVVSPALVTRCAVPTAGCLAASGPGRRWPPE